MSLIDMTETLVSAAKILKSPKKVNRQKAVNLLELFYNYLCKPDIARPFRS